MNEHQIQVAVADYLRLKKVLFCASAGGLHTSSTQAKKMKAAGYSKGHPDLLIYEPRGEFTGLAIELKTEQGQIRPEQAAWLEALRQRGWRAECCQGLKKALAVLDSYLVLPSQGSAGAI